MTPVLRNDAPPLVDLHCHVDLFPDPASIVLSLENRRVHTVAVTTAPSVFEHTKRLALGSRYLRAAVGLHPELVGSHGRELPRLLRALEDTRFVGEVGLDYSSGTKDVRSAQLRIFQEILTHCATYRNRVVTVHSRRAASDAIAAVGNGFPGRVVLHWFSGTKRELERALSYGLHFSINPAMISFASGRALAQAMPRERVLTESDGPFVRIGTRPAGPLDVARVVDWLASLWGTTPAEAARVIEANFDRLLAT